MDRGGDVDDAARGRARREWVALCRFNEMREAEFRHIERAQYVDVND